MSQLWQLQNIQTGEPLSPTQSLPENWGPIFGLAGIQDRLGDLSWLGEAYANQGWVQVDAQPPAEATREENIAHVAAQIAQRISESDPMVAADNTIMTKGKRIEWLEYRRQVNEVVLQAGYPDTILWPTPPN